MKPTRWFSAIFFFASSIALDGCYTHLATSDQGYYAYHAPRPYYSDTIRANPSLEKPLVVYDTTMHGDTMFIDERQVQPAAQAEGIEQNDSGSTTVNNFYGPGYYGPGGYWGGYGYYGPDWGFTIGIGWPYYNAWWPYYDYSWYEPFGYFGAPFYSPYYAFGFGGYGGYYGGYYGHGFHHHGFHDGFGGYAYNGYGLNVRPGRVGGEYRAGSITSSMTQPGSTIGLAGRSNLSNASNSSFAQTNAADELRSAADRNAPMHVVGPDASAAIARSASPDVRGETSNSFANTASRPVIVRRMDGQTMQTITTSSRAGRQMTVVRRSAGYSSRGYGSSSRGYNSSSRGYNSSSSRGYSAPARSYSAPARSYSAPAERSSGGGGGGYSSGRAGGGESSGGGGGGERSGGGGGGRR